MTLSNYVNRHMPCIFILDARRPGDLIPPMQPFKGLLPKLIAVERCKILCWIRCSSRPPVNIAT